MGLFDQFKSAKQGQFGEVGSIWKGMFNPDSDLTPPERKQAELNQSTQNLMSDREKLAAQSPEELAAKQQAGVQQDSSGAFRDMGLMNRGMGGENPMLGAIQNRQSKNYLRDVNAIKRQSEYEAPLQKQKLMNSVMKDRFTKAAISAGEADRDREQQLIQYEHDQHQTRVRNGVISGLFGTLMSFGGSIAGNESGKKPRSQGQSVREQAAAPKGRQYGSQMGYE